eukprot:2760736-Pyramimonas_sp.AAC.1
MDGWANIWKAQQMSTQEELDSYTGPAADGSLPDQEHRNIREHQFDLDLLDRLRDLEVRPCTISLQAFREATKTFSWKTSVGPDGLHLRHWGL